MSPDSLLHPAAITLQVFLIDLLLSGDNAVVIAMACHGLPPAQLRRAAMFGTVSAIAARFLLTSVAAVLVTLPLLKMVGAIALVWIAIKLTVGQEREAVGKRPVRTHPAPTFWSAVAAIIVADTVMSFDNVVALATASQGSGFFLALGLLLSVPLLMYGSVFVTGLLKRYPMLIRGGGAMLGWLAGNIAIADPLIAADVSQQAPVLSGLVPILVAVFVLAESRIIEQRLHTIKAPLRLAHAQPAPAFVATLRTPARNEPPGEIATTSVVEGSATPSVSRAQRALPWLAAVGVVAAVGLFLTFARMPAPEGLTRFVCPDESTIYFRHGGDVVRMSSYAGTISGQLRFGKIDWANYELATKTLGFLPPTEITYDDPKALVINGGRFVNISCASK
jgi:YjbE family integral membrane protein